MAVTTQQLYEGIRAGTGVPTGTALADMTRILEYANEAIRRYAPLAPESVKDMAIIQIGQYLYDAPVPARRSQSNVLNESGARALLAPYRTHTAQALDAIAAARQPDAGVAPGQSGLDTDAVRLLIRSMVKDFAEVGNPAIALGDTDFATEVNNALDIDRTSWDTASRTLTLTSSDGTVKSLVIPAGGSTSGLTEAEVEAKINALIPANRRVPAAAAGDRGSFLGVRAAGSLDPAFIPIPASRGGTLTIALSGAFAPATNADRAITDAEWNSSGVIDVTGSLTGTSDSNPYIISFPVQGTSDTQIGQLIYVRNTTAAYIRVQTHGLVLNGRSHTAGTVVVDPNTTVLVGITTWSTVEEVGGLSSGGSGVSSATAGGGLVEASGVLSVNPGQGIEVSGDKVQLHLDNRRTSAAFTLDEPNGLDLALGGVVRDRIANDAINEDKLDTEVIDKLNLAGSSIIGTEFNRVEVTVITTDSSQSKYTPGGTGRLSPLVDLDAAPYNGRGEFHVSAELGCDLVSGTDANFSWVRNKPNSYDNAEDRTITVSKIIFASELQAAEAWSALSDPNGEQIARVPLYSLNTLLGYFHLRLTKDSLNQVEISPYYENNGGNSLNYELTMNARVSFTPSDSAAVSQARLMLSSEGPLWGTSAVLPTPATAGTGGTLINLGSSDQWAVSAEGTAGGIGFDTDGRLTLPPSPPDAQTCGLWVASEVAGVEQGRVWLPWGPGVVSSHTAGSTTGNTEESVLSIKKRTPGRNDAKSIVVHYRYHESNFVPSIELRWDDDVPEANTRIKVYASGVFGAGTKGDKGDKGDKGEPGISGTTPTAADLTWQTMTQTAYNLLTSKVAGRLYLISG